MTIPWRACRWPLRSRRLSLCAAGAAVVCIGVLGVGALVLEVVSLGVTAGVGSAVSATPQGSVKSAAALMNGSVYAAAPFIQTAPSPAPPTATASENPTASTSVGSSPTPEDTVPPGFPVASDAHNNASGRWYFLAIAAFLIVLTPVIALLIQAAAVPVGRDSDIREGETREGENRGGDAHAGDAGDAADSGHLDAAPVASTSAGEAEEALGGSQQTTSFRQGSDGPASAAPNEPTP